MKAPCPVCTRPFDKREIAAHLEDAHHEIQVRDGETYAQAEARFLNDHKGARVCLRCAEQNRPWVIGVNPSTRWRKPAADAR